MSRDWDHERYNELLRLHPTMPTPDHVRRESDARMGNLGEIMEKAEADAPEPHEIIKASLSKNEHPTEGEWKRAIADRKVMEQAFAEHTPNPDSDTVSMSHKLRGERFIAVPEGAHTVGFVWKLAPLQLPAPEAVN